MPSFHASHKVFARIACFAAVMVLAISLASVQAQQVVGFRAGTAAFTAGSAGIVITFSAPMPTAKYAVSVQPTNTAGYSPTADCTYFNVLKKTTTNFQVQHKRCDTGTPVALDTNVSLDWMVWSHN